MRRNRKISCVSPYYLYGVGIIGCGSCKKCLSEKRRFLKRYKKAMKNLSKIKEGLYEKTK